MACPEWRDRLAGYVFGLLTVEDRRLVEEHSLDCQACFDDLGAGAEKAEVFRAHGERMAAARRRWSLSLAAAAAVLVIGVVAFQLPRDVEPSGRRGGVNAQVPRPLEPRGSGGRPDVFEWEAVEGAVQYEVRLHAADGRLLWDVATPDTRVGMPPDARDRLTPGAEHSWTVRARLPDGRLVESPLVSFTVRP